MAKRILSEYYTFDPATKTITIPNRILSREQLLLVVNVTSNTVLYNFSDPDLTLTSFTSPFSSTGTQFILSYNTVGMNAADPIMITEDIPEERFTPIEVLQDPTNKLRIAAPESLIDTDFEFGLQPIKWESLALLNNYPGFFYRGGANTLNLALGGISGGNQSPRSLITVTTVASHGVVTGDVVNVSYTSNFDADGVFPVVSATATTFAYVAKGVINGSVYLSSSVVQAGANYDIGNVPARFIVASVASDNAAANNAVTTGSVVTVTTTGKHGLLPGAPIMVNSATTTTINGVWTILDVPTATTFRYITPAIQTGTASPTAGNMSIMPRPEATFVHRPSDGGVMINTSNIQEGVAAIRQTRRYFRYQSGKGLAMSTGTKFVPNYDINTISSVGTSVSVTVQQALAISTGVSIVVEGVETNLGSTNPYNGTFVVQSVVNFSTSRTLTYNVATASTDTNPGGTNAQVTVRNWKGAACRVGMFDTQNGFYYEYDGTTMFAVRRQSIKELMGTITATSGSTTITGVNTKFHKQLTVGDYVVIRGQSYQVNAIDTGTSMEVSPAYRGATAAGLRINVTQNIRIPQSQWNLDRCDGSGPSGYVLDVTKMQMAYIDYTWYGAGFVRFGWRMTNGDVAYCHKIANNNVNNQAYMRSGNLPARYEVFNIGPYTKFVSNSPATPGLNLSSADAQMVVGDATYWPNDGRILVQQGANVEVMSYSGKVQNTSITNTWTLTGLARRQVGGSTSNLTFIPTEYEGGAINASSQCGITYIDCNCAPTVMHWGTSVIMDGGYDDDRSIVFAYARQTSITTVAANTSIAVLSIRLAPSVDNSITGQFGVREIINRMQLQMRGLGLVCNTSIQVLGVLNPVTYAGSTAPVLPDAWGITSIVTQIGSGSLAQIIDHTGNTTTVTGGEQIFGFVTSTGADNYDLGNVRDLGNSIISGPGSTRTPGFPNGPDILTIVLRNNNAGAATITNMRLSWTEAQA